MGVSENDFLFAGGNKEQYADLKIEEHNASEGAHPDVRDKLSELTKAVDGKVDVVAGKGLSTVDYTPEEAERLSEALRIGNGNSEAIRDIKKVLGDKVSKEAGKGLSTNDFNDEAVRRLNEAARRSEENAERVKNHTENSGVHVTTEEKEQWNNKPSVDALKPSILEAENARDRANEAADRANVAASAAQVASEAVGRAVEAAQGAANYATGRAGVAEEKALLADAAAKKAEEAAATVAADGNAAILQLENNEGLRILAERERVSAEEGRLTAEELRGEAEKGRIDAESKRLNSELQRVENEGLRVSAETERIEKETAREKAESERSTEEKGRTAAETQRNTNEEARTAAEVQRVQSETERITAEAERQEAYEQMGNLFSNALVGSGSGSSVYLDDVSPIEHEPKISVEGETPEKVTLYACGKNLLDKDNVNPGLSNMVTQERNGDNFILQGNYGVSDFAYSTGCFSVKTPFYMQNSIYTVSFYITLLEQGERSNKVALMLLKNGSDVASSNDNWSNKPVLEVGKRRQVKVCNVDGKVFNTLWIYLNGNKVLIEYDTMQIECGNTATEFESYSGQSYSVNADGTAQGVKLLHPVTNLTTNNTNAVIHCGYNRDSNKVIEKLTNAIISLGGNV